ncbi:MAG: DUF819 family protein [Myxococcales bacterium]|nr:DUF819 family protein [Myxococcales bacterium]MCB9642641.1 DUF819 family protein [Myxococcales bacterium]
MTAAKIASGLFQAFYTFGFPAFSLWMARRFKLAEALGPVVLCYLFGITIANLGGWFPLNPHLSKEFYENTVPIAIPLLLFSTDFPRWLRMSRTTLLSFGLMVVSVITSSSLAYYFLGKSVEEAHKVSGMLVGLYTGGTPNMNAIGIALGTKEHIFPLVNGTDLALGGVYLFFLLSFAKPLLGRLLPAYPTPVPAGDVEHDEKVEAEAHTPTHEFSWRDNMAGMIKSFFLAAGIVGVSVGLSLLLTGKLDVAVIILSITTLGVLCSFIPNIRKIEGSYELGDYILLCFATALGSSVNIAEMLKTDLAAFFVYTAVIMFGALGMHLILAIIFRIDVDTAIITSTAGIYGPPFVPAVVRALNNREVLVSGLTTGLVGYAIGNYLGIWLARILGG